MYFLKKSNMLRKKTYLIFYKTMNRNMIDKHPQMPWVQVDTESCTLYHITPTVSFLTQLWYFHLWLCKEAAIYHRRLYVIYLVNLKEDGCNNWMHLIDVTEKTIKTTMLFKYFLNKTIEVKIIKCYKCFLFNIIWKY